MARRLMAMVCGMVLATLIPAPVLAEHGADDHASGTGEAAEPPPTTLVITIPLAAPSEPSAPPPDPATEPTATTGAPAPSPDAPDTTDRPDTTDIPDTTDAPTDPPDTAPTTASVDPPVDADATADGDTDVAPASSEPSPPTTSTHPVVEHSRQAVEASTTQTAIATTGGNHSSAPTSGGAAVSGSTDITTGGATAVGSADRTTVTQQAVTTVTDDAIAQVSQVVFVLNVGAAFADTGSNTGAVGANGAAGNATVQTGNATAVGNDATTSIVQATAGNAPAGTSSTTEQSVVALHIGLAVADSGVNVIASTSTSTGAGAATIETGTAHAVGNLSTTQVAQLAQAAASGTATIDINQWATVLNLGLALANTGGNDIGSLLGDVVDHRDQHLAEQLVAVLLPALLTPPEPATGPAAGAVSTGDATAIGNRATTVISQSATAAAAGDGAVVIDQRAVVANVGVAAANTGSNVVAAGAGMPLSPDAQRVVDDISAALTGFLAQVDAAAAGELEPGEPLRLTLTIGDVTIEVDATLTGAVLGLEAGAQATVRQVTAVFDIGVAYATTGDNVGVVSGGEAALVAALTAAAEARAAADGPVTVSISTGDATATNRSVLAVCQVDDVSPTVCEPDESPDEGEEQDDDGEAPAVPNDPEQPGLTPPGPGIRRPTAPVERPGAPAAPIRGELPATGSDPGALVAIATALVLLGGCLLRLGRRPAR